jgi:hypothetical protein
MNRSKFVGFSAILGVLLLAAISTSLKAYAWDTHMTLHNLQDEVGDEGPAELSIEGISSSCTAQASSTCEAGADLVWYTVDVCVTSCDDAIWKTTLHGVYGHCDIYVQSKNSTGFPPVFDATHHCAAAEKAGLNPPSTTTATPTPTPASEPQGQNRTK